jgi:hypothetical protein
MVLPIECLLVAVGARSLSAGEAYQFVFEV